jgi:hypothetical protein
MRWRSALFVLVWISVILLLMFPTACRALFICRQSSVPLVILLGVFGALLAVSDMVQVRREARAKLFGTADIDAKETASPKL